jgi:hypothetical protein
LRHWEATLKLWWLSLRSDLSASRKAVIAISLSLAVSFTASLTSLGDGIFDKLSNEEVAECVWMSVRDVADS